MVQKKQATAPPEDLPAKGQPIITGPDYEVVNGREICSIGVALRVDATFVARFDFLSPDRETMVIRSLSVEAVDPEMTAAVTSSSLRKVPFGKARDQATIALSNVGDEQLFWAPQKTSPGRSPYEDQGWLKSAVEYVEASRRDPRHVYAEMGRAFSGISEGVLQWWVRQCRSRGLITPHPTRELTPKALRLLKKHPTKLWAPD